MAAEAGHRRDGLRCPTRGRNLVQKIDGDRFCNRHTELLDVSSRERSITSSRCVANDSSTSANARIDYDWTVAETHRHSPYVAFVPIIEGCNKFCTYCIVPFSRGREPVFRRAEIVRQVLTLRQEGVKEVHLIGQNVNSYRPESRTV